MFGLFNMRKAGSPWHDVRLRQAANVAINREDLIRYATRGNGVIIPALLPVASFGYDPDLAPYAFDPGKARHLLREAGYPDGLALSLIAPEDLEVQATSSARCWSRPGSGWPWSCWMPTPISGRRYLAQDRPPAQLWILPCGVVIILNFSALGRYHYFAIAVL